NLGLALFPDSAQIGLWEMADKVNGNLPYKQLVSVGPLPAKLGLISRRQQLVQIDSSLRPLPNTPLALNQSILAAYKQMSVTYQPKSTNAVIVMTAGVGTAPGDQPGPDWPGVLPGRLAPDLPGRGVHRCSLIPGGSGFRRGRQKTCAFPCQ